METEKLLPPPPPPQQKSSLVQSNKGGDLCLVCCLEVPINQVNKKERPTNLLSSNLKVMFLFKNLLQVPEEQLLANMRKYGDPINWITLCKHCHQLTSEAMERHLQILTLVNQLRSILKLIVRKTRDSNHVKVQQHRNKKKTEIWRWTREFVMNCKPSKSTKNQLVNYFF